MFLPLITWKIHGKVLHIMFPSQGQLSFLTSRIHPELHYANPEFIMELFRISERYEGKNLNFVGFNVPSAVVEASEPYLHSILVHHPSIQYIIGYIEGDEESKAHEERHARYYTDRSYRTRVARAWKRMQDEFPDQYQAIVQRLTKDNYQPHVFEDEFQAYHPEKVERILNESTHKELKK